MLITPVSCDNFSPLSRSHCGYLETSPKLSFVPHSLAIPSISYYFFDVFALEKIWKIEFYDMHHPLIWPNESFVF